MKLFKDFFRLEARDGLLVGTLFYVFLVLLVGLISALFGVFYKEVFSVILYIGVVFVAWLYYRTLSPGESPFLTKKGIVTLCSIVIGIVSIIFLALWSTPSVFSGRDQGAISMAATFLVDHHSLVAHTRVSDTFFSLYGSGEALNFPGFFYSDTGGLVSHFPFVSITWYAIFFSVFGDGGFIIANAVTFGLFLWVFYSLLQKMIERIVPDSHRSGYISAFLLIGVLFIVSSFVLRWFFTYTLSEHIALLLVWSVVYFLYSIVTRWSGSSSSAWFYIVFCLGSMLLVFSRIEGILFVALSIGVLLYFNREDLLHRLLARRTVYAVIGGLALLGALSFSLSQPFLISLYHAIFESSGGASGSTFFDELFTRIVIFVNFGMIGYLLLGFFGIVFVFLRRDWKLLIPFLVGVPVCYYLFDPMISSDVPWSLRRYFFYLLPVFMLYSVICLVYVWTRLDRLWAPIGLGMFAIAFSLPLTLLTFSFSPDRTLLRQTIDFVEEYQKHDLLLIDRFATGSGYSMMSGAAHALLLRNAAYVFNPQDLLEIDTKGYGAVYLVVPDQQTSFWTTSVVGPYLTPVDTYTIRTERLQSQSESDVRFFAYPNIEEVSVSGIVYSFSTQSETSP